MLIKYLRYLLNGLEFLLGHFRSDECFRMYCTLDSSRFSRAFIYSLNSNLKKDITKLEQDLIDILLKTLHFELESPKRVPDYVDICVEALSVNFKI